MFNHPSLFLAYTMKTKYMNLLIVTFSFNKLLATENLQNHLIHDNFENFFLVRFHQ